MAGENTNASFDDEPDLTEESLQKKLSQYHEAFRQEFETSLEEDPENIEEYTRKFFKDNLPMAIAQIVHLAGAADSETVRLNASKYVVEAAFADSAAAGDPIKDLLKQLQKAPVN